ncbi:HAD-IB family hydrolase [Clostridium sp. D2Q-14]|nr:HAD-IB family hydrolase [Anaeromonas gelatinilytica]
MIEHFKKLIRYEVIDELIWHKHVKQTFEEWEKRYRDFEDYLEELADIYVRELKGVNKSHIEFIAHQVININGDKVYKYARDRIKWHQDQGHKVFFISGSPEFLVGKMAEKYGVTQFRGSKYVVDENNNFTGEIIKMWDSFNKQRALDEFVEKFNIDLDNSYAYGDTTGDLSMMKMVGNPVAINPNRDLYNCIKEDKDISDKISIIIERKDMIYKVNSSVEILD